MGIIVGNFDYTGTDKFVSHKLFDFSDVALCGLRINWSKGDWQTIEVPKPSCKKCARRAERRTPSVASVV